MLACPASLPRPQLYNEEVRDLLSRDARERLELRESPERGVHVRGLKEFVVKSAQEMRGVLEVGGLPGGLGKQHACLVCGCWAVGWVQSVCMDQPLIYPRTVLAEPPTMLLMHLFWLPPHCSPALPARWAPRTAPSGPP